MTSPTASGGLKALWAGSSALAPEGAGRAFWVGLAIVVLSVFSALATYLILMGLTPIAPRNEVVLTVLLLNGALILAMIAVIAWQIAGLWRAWRERLPGARLHVRIVALFSVIAAVPALLLAVAATSTFSRSLDSWFSTRTRAIIDNSMDVAKAYLDEHGQIIRLDIVNMARDLDGAASLVKGDTKELQQLVMAQAGLRDLPVAYVIDTSGKPLVSAIEDARLPYQPPPPAALQQAEAGQVPLLMPVNSNRIAAIAKLKNYPGQFVYVARGVNAKVVGHLQRAEQNVDEYNRLRRSRGGLTLAHALMYLMISMTSMLAAIWVGMWFAGKFVAPIRRLIAGAQEVSGGNLDVELPERRGEGDLRRLSETFNTMTRELKTQRNALVTANQQLTERRQFMEAVLSGVSAGVIGLDSNDRITLASRSAETLLGRVGEDLSGRHLLEVVPQFAPALEKRDDPGVKKSRSEEVTLQVGGNDRTFAVRVTREKAGEGDVGSVVTFDDVTDLVVAQRTSAWADVARRIAHEIKNPLTPIILSVGRLRKNYGHLITEKRELFDSLTATIERQAGDIKTMVDEFAAFARMPTPEMERCDLIAVVREPTILFREGHPKVSYAVLVPETPVFGSYDRRLITQAVTNLVKNATEAVEQLAEQGGQPDDWQGRVETHLRLENDRVLIEVVDNGVGLPVQNRSRLTEPYMTTKGHKGTGLGLAMVQKITEQHGGALTLEDAPKAPGRSSGALVRMTLPLTKADGASGPATYNTRAEAKPARAAAT